MAELTKTEERYLDRELSWLAFNFRVLELAEDPDQPLLERVRYLAICSSNLDEFYMVRIAGLTRRIAAGVAVPAASGLMPREVLERTLERTRELMARQTKCFRSDVLPALAAEGIDIVRWDDLAEDERPALRQLFSERIFPVLTPLAVDPAHPFPYISGLSLNLAVVVRNPRTGTDHFARVKVPPNFARFLPVTDQRFVPLEDVIAAHLGDLFPGMQVLQHHTFRVTRNEDVEVEEDDAENLLTAMERELMRRRFGPAVRLEVEETVDPHVLDLLQRELGVSDGETFMLQGPLDLTGLDDIADIDRAELKYRPFLPATHRDLPDVESALPADMFAAISKGDVLVHHPYDSFSTSVQRFIEQAAADPRVLAIKQTLYRTSGDSPIVDALVDAAEAGKQVLALVEIKARFDEQANITWARKLEHAGVHVVYGIVGLKTHCKLCLVVRDEAGGVIRRYSHIGTGNYHPKTARGYEDLGLLTADPEVAEDVNLLFNTLSGYSVDSEYRRLLVAPQGLRSGIIERIEREIEHRRAGRPARIRFKLNSLVDESIVEALYSASEHGVPVDIWVRGICSVRAGVPGLSENIRVRSILGRFLEHSRIFAFDNGSDPEYWIGSADLMHRNLDRRVEVLVKLGRHEHLRELAGLFDLAFDPGTASWHLKPDGSWVREHLGPDNEPLIDLQQMLIERKRRRRSAS
ncbi:RNA degradosome polyphosphate kinase [Haloactinopolyspora sp.]|uniref:RNA degradosome polyphosphate kinase n=1 Tax=Haloactinopolyspora sp. TaxID=1966353 RepID=UPI00260EC768|nr:RNA degradosome polyphosphate kinase [Haloactinopolyspora sp.]